MADRICAASSFQLRGTFDFERKSGSFNQLPLDMMMGPAYLYLRCLPRVHCGYIMQNVTRRRRHPRHISQKEALISDFVTIRLCELLLFVPIPGSTVTVTLLIGLCDLSDFVIVPW